MQRLALVLALGALSAGCGGSTPHPVPDGGGGADATDDADVDGPDDATDAPVAVDAPSDATDATVAVDAPSDATDATDAVDATPDTPDGSVLGPWSEIRPCAVIGGNSFGAAAFSASGNVLAVGGTAPRIFAVGTSSSLTLTRTLAGLGGLALSIALSPDGTTIAAGARAAAAGAGAGVAVWRVADGSLIWTRPAKQGDFQVAFSPDGGLLAIGSADKTVELARAASGQSAGTYTGHRLGVQAVAFSPDGTMIASSENASMVMPEVHLWRVTDQTLVRNLGAWGGLGGLAFSPDGTQLLSGNGVLLNVADGAIVRTIGSLFVPGPVAFAPDGKTYFINGRLDRASDGGELRYVLDTPLRGAAYTPDSSQIFVVPNTLGSRPYLWRVADGTTGTTLQPDTIDGSFGAVSPDGQRVLFGARMFRLADGAAISGFAPPSAYNHGGAFSPDGATVALATVNLGTTGSGVALLDGVTGSLKKDLGSHSGLINALAFSPAGDLLASAAEDHQVKLWDVNTSAMRVLGGGIDGHTGAVKGLAWAPAGDLLASIGKDNAVIIWRVSDGTIVRTLAPGAVSAGNPAFFPDGKSIVTSFMDTTNNGARIWDVATGNALKTIMLPRLNAAAGQALTPSGDLVASISGGVYLWPPSTGQIETTLAYPFSTTWSSFTASGIVASAGGAPGANDVDNYAIHWCRNR
jgi:WD40 repeat protein